MLCTEVVWQKNMYRFTQFLVGDDKKHSLVPTPTTLSLIGIAAIWGGTFIAGRQLADSSPPLLSAFLRFFIASIALALCLPCQRIKLNLGQKTRVFFLGLFGIFFYNICFFYGLQYISASRASLIVSINPAVIALSAFLFMHEKLSLVKQLGIAACSIGAATIILSKDPAAIIASSATWKGDLLILGCVISWVTYSIFSRPLIREIGAINAVFYSVLTGTIMLFFAVLIKGDLTVKNLLNLGFVQIVCLFFLGIFGSALAYVWYYRGIEKIGATRAGVYIALVPLFAVTFGQIILHEPIDAITIVGGLLVLAGIILCNKK
jgi:drug/metabolite transporter (DMT)-like permease